MEKGLASIKRGSRIVLPVAITGACLFILLVILAIKNSTGLLAVTMDNFATLFLSILLEALPFVLIGVLISSVIHHFVTEDLILRLIPKNKLLGLFASSLLGFVFPICECVNVPVTRRLISKGVPLYIGITFMMSVAIVNPVVLFSTYYAFSGRIAPVIARALFGIAGAVIIGFIISVITPEGSVLRQEGGHDHGHDHNHSHGCGCGSPAHSTGKPKVRDHLLAIIKHTSGELFSVGRFLILGALVSSLMQTLLPREILNALGQGEVLSVLIMMLLAYVLSLCSEADAFIAATFLGYFTPGAIFAFILFGPMMDIKNTLMLLDGFKTRFVLRLIWVTTLVCFTFGLIINVFNLPLLGY